jgi:hypothetical protein
MVFTGIAGGAGWLYYDLVVRSGLVLQLQFVW